ncbi:MAG: hypothetical protein NBV67_02430 [Tagaea sp.]|nr:hypothetical protein [Tagaea sp.]
MTKSAHYCPTYTPPLDGGPSPWALDLPAGPWRREFADHMLGVVVVDRDGREILEVRNRTPAGMPEARCKAIADLSAAAPELYAAAKLGLAIAESWVHDQLDGTGGVDDALKELEPVRAAIAKAEGRKLP